eukprot:jgi/Psemu1/30861/gm1.30861_g
MVPPPEAYDWSNVYGIAFKFQSDNNPQEVLSLKGYYAETVPLTVPKISTLFTLDANDEGPRTLGPAPVTALREAFCKSITLNMANIDELKKGHIAQLINSCPVRFVKPGSPNQRIRNPHEFDSAGREAVRQAKRPTTQNHLQQNWKTDDPANYFNSIYTDDNNIPSDTNADAIVTTPHSSSPSVPPNSAILTVPIKPFKSEAHAAIQVPSSCVTSSSATTDLPTIKLIDFHSLEYHNKRSSGDCQLQSPCRNQFCSEPYYQPPDQQPASTLKDVKGAIACGALEQTNARAVSLKEETKDPNQDGRLHRVSRSSNKQGKRDWTIQPKEPPRLASVERNQYPRTLIFHWKEERREPED